MFHNEEFHNESHLKEKRLKRLSIFFINAPWSHAKLQYSWSKRFWDENCFVKESQGKKSICMRRTFFSMLILL